MRPGAREHGRGGGASSAGAGHDEKPVEPVPDEATPVERTEAPQPPTAPPGDVDVASEHAPSLGEALGMTGGAATAEVEEALAVPEDREAGAFFDVDNTIMRGASIFHLARGLYRRKFFTLHDIVSFARQQARFTLLGEDMQRVGRVQERALSFVAGHSVAELTAIGEEVFDELMAPKIWPGTAAMARIHLEAGQRVWLVTATPVEVAEVIARRLGLTGALGTVAEHVDGIYTGRLVGPPMHGSAKADAVQALAEREGLDLRRCAAYSDSAHDIPLLSLVGSPCAVNPDSRLRSHARAHGWQVRDYRTGRKAVKVGVPSAALAGAVAGAAAAALAARRRRR